MYTKSYILSNPKLVFFFAPAALFIFPHIFLVVGGYEAWMMPTPREGGFVENATAFFFLLAGIYALCIIKSDIGGPVILFRVTLFFFGLMAIWVCLEEISYGQNFFHYRTPEWFLEHNKNREFNLHNLGNDAPSYALRTAGYALVTIVGILAPLIMGFIGKTLSASGFIYYFVPTTWMIVPSLFHLFANLPKNIITLLPGGEEFIDAHYYFSESGEYEEYMLGVWAVLYIVSVHIAIRNRSMTDFS